MKQFNISIPKPCHEDWNKMTPNEKGKFCASCSKTVVDFTQKSTQEIQDYFQQNSVKRVCGHFYRKQLDSVVLQIPSITFQQKLSFQKLFILSLIFVMGTSLFSCKTNNGKTQKIEKVELIDSLKISPAPTDKLKENIELNNKTNLIEEVGEVEVEGDVIFGFIIIEEPTRFKEAKKLSIEDARKDFNQRITKFVQENFDTEITKNLGLKKGKHKIYGQFVIDTLGKVSDVKVKAPHPILKKEVKELIRKLPEFIPAKQKGKPVKTKYTLPIAFLVE